MIKMQEKRKFNYVVLALLVLAIVGGILLYMGII